jgi:hypothetical protein
MIDLHDPCPPAHLPPERLVVLGLLTPLLCGVLVSSFVLLPLLVTCFVAFFLFVVVKALATACWEGSKEVGLRFVVVASRTGQPIQGAKISLFPSALAGPTPEACTEAATGSEGSASWSVSCRVVECRGLFGVGSSVYFDGWWFQITAAGYKGTGRECWAWHTGCWSQDINNPDPPPIRVDLKRLPAAGEG